MRGTMIKKIFCHDNQRAQKQEFHDVDAKMLHTGGT